MFTLGQIEEGSETLKFISAVPSLECYLEFFTDTVRGRTPCRRHEMANIGFTHLSGDGIVFRTVWSGGRLEWHAHLLSPNEVVYLRKMTGYFFQAIGEEPLVMSLICCPEQEYGYDVEFVDDPDPDSITIHGNLLVQVIEVADGEQIVVKLPDGKQITFAYGQSATWKPGELKPGSMANLAVAGKSADFVQWGMILDEATLTHRTMGNFMDEFANTGADTKLLVGIIAAKYPHLGSPAWRALTLGWGAVETIKISSALALDAGYITQVQHDNVMDAAATLALKHHLSPPTEEPDLPLTDIPSE